MSNTHALDTASTPREIVKALDHYIIGQEEAKRQVAIALRNRWRTEQAPPDIREEIIPNNILMIGSTGVGKTEIARRLAALTQAPFVKVEASKFTEVGYVGRDVESMVRDLVEQSVRMVQKEKRKTLEARALVAVEAKILDALMPPLTPKEVHEDEAITEQLNQKSRERLLQRLRAAELDDKYIEFDLEITAKSPVGLLSSGGMIDEGSLVQLQEMFSSMMPKQKKKKRLRIGEAKRMLLEQELDKSLDMDEVKEEALALVQRAGIIFIDEIDKIAIRGGAGSGEGPSVSQEGVQRDLLPIIEGSAVPTKYGIVHTDRILFVAAGAFHVAKPSDLIPELQGRFPARIELEDLNEDDFLRILSEPRAALTKQYEALFASEGVRLHFTPPALKRMAQMAMKLNASLENIGARRLHTIMGNLLSEWLFDVPDKLPKNKEVRITTEAVDKALAPLLEDQNLSHYLL